jgi:cell division protein FtsB
MGTEERASVPRLTRPSVTQVVLCIAFAAIGYLAFTTARYVVHNYQLRGQETQLRAQLTQMDQDHAQLLALRDYLQSDEYVEDVARRQLGLVRPGETLVVVSQADTVPTGSASPPPTGATPGAPWWKDLFPPAGLTPATTPTPAR